MKKLLLCLISGLMIMGCEVPEEKEEQEEEIEVTYCSDIAPEISYTDDWLADFYKDTHGNTWNIDTDGYFEADILAKGQVITGYITEPVYTRNTGLGADYYQATFYIQTSIGCDVHICEIERAYPYPHGDRTMHYIGSYYNCELSEAEYANSLRGVYMNY